MHYTFVYISFPFLQDYDVKMPNFAFYRGRKQPPRNLFLFLSLDMVSWNSPSGGFAYIWQRKWVGIIAIKSERTQIHFLIDVLVAVASLDLYVSNAFRAEAERSEFSLVAKCNPRFIKKKISQLKSDMRSYRCKTFSIKQAPGHSGPSPWTRNCFSSWANSGYRWMGLSYCWSSPGC